MSPIARGARPASMNPDPLGEWTIWRMRGADKCRRIIGDKRCPPAPLRVQGAADSGAASPTSGPETS